MPLLGILIYLYLVFFSGNTLYYILNFRIDIAISLISLVIFLSILYLYGRSDTSIGSKLFIALIIFILINVIGWIHHGFLKELLAIKIIYFLSLVLLAKSIIFWIIAKRQIQFKGTLKKIHILLIMTCISSLGYFLGKYIPFNIFKVIFYGTKYDFFSLNIYIGLLYFVLAFSSTIYYLIPHINSITSSKIFFFCFMLLLYFTLVFFQATSIGSLFNPLLTLPVVVSYLNTFNGCFPDQKLRRLVFAYFLILISVSLIFINIYKFILGV